MRTAHGNIPPVRRRSYFPVANQLDRRIAMCGIARSGFRNRLLLQWEFFGVAKHDSLHCATSQLLSIVFFEFEKWHFSFVGTERLYVQDRCQIAEQLQAFCRPRRVWCVWWRCPAPPDATHSLFRYRIVSRSRLFSSNRRRLKRIIRNGILAYLLPKSAAVTGAMMWPRSCSNCQAS